MPPTSDPILDLLAVPDSARMAPVRARLERARGRGRKAFVLFGCGFLGRVVAGMLRDMGIQPVAFADNNPRLAGSEVAGIPVLGPAEAAERYRDSAVFVVTVYTNGPVLRQLESMGLEAITFPEFTWCFPESCLPHGPLAQPSFLAAQASRIQEAAGIWADEASRLEYLGQVAWRVTLDRSVLPPNLPLAAYGFPDDLVRVGPDEVFVDCGAYDGDTLRALLRRVPGGVKRFFGVEPDARNVEALRSCIAALPPEVGRSCTVLPCVLGRSEGVVRFLDTGSVISRPGEAGNREVPVRRLDDLLQGTVPTYIKMDIEGAERAALEGAAGTLRRHHPVLAVCLYHKPEDLWDLPLLIRELAPGYRLLLRRYCDDCWEQVCYAIPPGRMA